MLPQAEGRNKGFGTIRYQNLRDERVRISGLNLSDSFSPAEATSPAGRPPIVSEPSEYRAYSPSVPSGAA
jgi:hypothetical protein